jgi:hypothetical protein
MMALISLRSTGLLGFKLVVALSELFNKKAAAGLRLCLPFVSVAPEDTDGENVRQGVKTPR